MPFFESESPPAETEKKPLFNYLWTITTDVWQELKGHASVPKTGFWHTEEPAFA